MKKLLIVVVALFLLVPSARAMSILNYSFAIQYRLMKADPDYKPDLVEFAVMEKKSDSYNIGAFGSIAIVNPDKLTVSMVMLNLLDDAGKPLSGKAKTKAVAAIAAMENYIVFIDEVMTSLKKTPLSEAEKILDLIYSERPSTPKENFMIHSTETNAYMATSSSDVFAIFIIPKE